MSILKAFFVLLVLSCCSCFSPAKTDVKWELPKKLKPYRVEFVPFENGFWISGQDTSNLISNISDMKIYEDRLEDMIKEIKEIKNNE